MGAITPVLGTIGSIAGGVVSAREQNKQVKQQQQRIDQEQDSFEKDRQTSLKRAVARRRAKFGANNVSVEGSGEAILLGLFDETDEEIKRREELDRIRQQSLDSDRVTGSTRSLLNAASDLFSSSGNSSRIVR